MAAPLRSPPSEWVEGPIALIEPANTGREADFTYRSVDGKAYMDYRRDESGQEWVRCRFPAGLDQGVTAVPTRWQRAAEVVQEPMRFPGSVVIHVGIAVTLATGARFGIIIEPLPDVEMDVAP